MDRERLSELLHDPSKASKQDVAGLHAMADRFPWFSGAHLLLAVGKHEAGDVLANDRQGIPAAHLPSRAVLYDLVHKEQQHTPLRVVGNSTPPIAEATPEMPAQPAHAPGDSIVQSGPPGSPDGAAPAPVLPADAPTAPVDTPGPAPLPVHNAAAPTPEHPQAEPDILDLQIKEAIRASGYDLGAATAPPPVPATGILPEKPPAESRAAATPPQGTAQEVSAPAPLTRNSRLKFTDWLDQQGLPLDPAPPAAPAGELPTAPSAASAATPAALNPREIMEQFIQRSVPVDTKAKARFFNPQQAAKQSLEDHGLVSETLARVLEKQGNFSKAREVYDRLALKHPGKSVYFAALSKALEARSNK